MGQVLPDYTARCSRIRQNFGSASGQEMPDVRRLHLHSRTKRLMSIDVD